MGTRNALVLWGFVAIALALIGTATGEGLLLGVLVCVPLMFLSAALIETMDRGGGARLLGTFLLAVAMRWAIATFIQQVVYRSSPGLFSPDELGYYDFGHALAEEMHGRPAVDAFPIGVAWIIAVIEYLFGRGAMIPKLVNGVVGGWTAVMAGLIAQRFYPAPVVRRTALLAALWPSLALWASLMTKDNWTLFGVELSLLAYLHLRERFRLRTLLLLVFGLLAVSFHRSYEVLFIGVGIGAGFVVGFQRHRRRNLLLFAALSLVVTVIALQTDALVLFQADRPTLETINVLRSAYTEGAGSGIDVSIVDTSTPIGLALWAPIGMLYFFLAPIPFTGRSATALATSPEMLVWYAVLPQLWGGLRDAYRSGKLRELVPLLCYCLISSIGWSMAVTNTGSLYRYRGQVMFVPLILIAARQVQRRVARRPQPVPALVARAPAQR